MLLTLSKCSPDVSWLRKEILVGGNLLTNESIGTRGLLAKKDNVFAQQKQSVPKRI